MVTSKGSEYKTVSAVSSPLKGFLEGLPSLYHSTPLGQLLRGSYYKSNISVLND